MTLVLMGYIDWLTTIIGISHFGAVEANPFLSSIAASNLVAFTAIKLTTTIFVGLLYYLGDRTLLRTKNKDSKYLHGAHIILRGGYAFIATILLAAILNNLIVFARII